MGFAPLMPGAVAGRFGLNGFEGQSNDVLILANGLFFVVFRDSKAGEVNRQQQGAVVISKWAAVVHA
jgi:hypothetical protein